MGSFKLRKDRIEGLGGFSRFRGRCGGGIVLGNVCVWVGHEKLCASFCRFWLEYHRSVPLSWKRDIGMKCNFLCCDSSFCLRLVPCLPSRSGCACGFSHSQQRCFSQHNLPCVAALLSRMQYNSLPRRLPMERPS